MKPDLQIQCVKCSGLSDFFFASKINVKKKDAECFSKSKHFVLEEDRAFRYNKTKFFTRYYPIISPALENISDIPAEYKTSNRNCIYYSSSHRMTGGHGVIVCKNCMISKKHKLIWPQDAYFQIDYKGKTLWAYDRFYALKLLAYIKSNDRKKRLTSTTGYITQDYFLRKIPKHFQTKKARDEIVKKLTKILSL